MAGAQGKSGSFYSRSMRRRRAAGQYGAFGANGNGKLAREGREGVGNCCIAGGEWGLGD
jgi:hypothetical protein